MKKWFISVITAFTLAITMFAVQSKADFLDLEENSYYYIHVNDLVERGQISGYPDGTFKAGKYVTRAEAAQMVAKFGGRYYPIDEALTRYAEEGYELMPLYRDVPAAGKWYSRAVYSLAHDNIVNGYPDGLFKPDDTITRGEIAKILRGMLDLEYSDGLIRFPDIKGHFAERDIETLASLGLFLGKDGKHFAPDEPLKRGDLAVMLYRLNVDHDLVLSGDQLDVNKYYLEYDWQWLEQQIEKGQIDNEQPYYFVQGEDMATFLNDIQFVEDSRNVFEPDSEKSYIVTHFANATCAPNVTLASQTMNMLVMNEMNYYYQSLLEHGEVLACPDVVTYALKVYEVPTETKIQHLQFTNYPYKRIQQFNTIDVLPY